jgi:hypothetical protein
VSLQATTTEENAMGSNTAITSRVVGVLMAAVMVVGLAACGGTDEQASTCDALQNLSTEIAGLADVDLVGEGTSALNEQIDAVETSWDEAKTAADGQFASQFSDLESSLVALGSAVESLVSGGQSVSESLSTLQADVTAVGDAWSALATTASDELGDCDLSA